MNRFHWARSDATAGFSEHDSGQSVGARCMIYTIEYICPSQVQKKLSVFTLYKWEMM